MVTRRGRITRGLVVLVCEHGHDHVMAPEQATRIRRELCPWLKRSDPHAIAARIDLSMLNTWDGTWIEALSA